MSATAQPHAVLRLLGLAQRAGALRLGAQAVLRALRDEGPGAVILARDCGDGLARRVERRAQGSLLDRTAFTTDELARAFARERLAVVSVHEPAFVGGLRTHWANRGEAT